MIEEPGAYRQKRGVEIALEDAKMTEVKVAGFKQAQVEPSDEFWVEELQEYRDLPTDPAGEDFDQEYLENQILRPLRAKMDRIAQEQLAPLQLRYRKITGKNYEGYQKYLR